MEIVKATDVFVPGDFPKFTYVARAEEELEKRFSDALETPKTVISVSGPSKTGKTVLVLRMIGEDLTIPIYGAQIRTSDDLWEAILNWIEVPSEVAVTNSNAGENSAGFEIAAKLGAPSFGSIGAKGKVGDKSGYVESNQAVQRPKGMAAVAREISNSDYTVFLDDFHYIPREHQEEIGKAVKSGTEARIKFCIASVPHRSDDVVRSNHELRGRTINIDTKYWSLEELKRIAIKGFEELRMLVPENIIERLARESCTSPQIMQSLCLQLCFDLGVRQKLETATAFEIEPNAISKVLEQVSTRAEFTSLLKQMHAGPRIRGTERKEFAFHDGSSGDAYRAALLVIAQDPPQMEINYSDITERLDLICKNDKPVGSSIVESFKQIEGFANRMHPNQKILEWDSEAASGTLSIIDPYFLFFVRSSDRLTALGR